jgi:predicted transcriptional regulator
MVLTVTLPDELEKPLNITAEALGVTNDVIAQRGLAYFLAQNPLTKALLANEGQLPDSYELGKEYFGKYDLGSADLSVTYKQRLRNAAK